MIKIKEEILPQIEQIQFSIHIRHVLLNTAHHPIM